MFLPIITTTTGLNWVKNTRTLFVRTRISKCAKQLKYNEKLIYHSLIQLKLKQENVGHSKLAADDFHQKFNFFFSLSRFWLRASKKIFCHAYDWEKRKKTRFYKGFGSSSKPSCTSQFNGAFKEVVEEEKTSY